MFATYRFYTFPRLFLAIAQCDVIYGLKVYAHTHADAKAVRNASNDTQCMLISFYIA